MDYYQILGINRSASQSDIKAAFRKLAMQHHPDQGGDENRFKEINEAYSILSDPEKRRQYDNPQSGFKPFFESGYTQDPWANQIFEEIFKANSHFYKKPEPKKNNDLSLKCRISLRDSYLGRAITVSFQLPDGLNENIEVTIPPGVEHGQTLRIAGHGDNRRKDLPRGDLIITIEVTNYQGFAREGQNLITKAKINVFEAITGTTVRIRNINDDELDVAIKSGVRHGQRVSCKGLGFKNPKYPNVVGDLIVVLDVETPKIPEDQPELIEKIKKLSDKIYGSKMS